MIKLIPNFTMCVIASRRSGKSVFCKYLLARKGGLLDTQDKIILFTTGVNKDYNTLIKKENIITKYNSNIIKKIMKYQENRKQNKKKMPKITIILDDVITSKTRYDATLEKIFFTGRHFNISLILVSQSFSCISPSFLRNSDYVCFFRFFIKQDREKIISIMGMYCNQRDCEAILSKSEKHKIFILDMTSDSIDIKEKINCFKVPKKFIDI